MTIDRRRLILGGTALLAVAACDSGPATLTVNAEGVSGMNPGPDGLDRPMTLTVIQMRNDAAFDSADVFSLQDPQTALGADFVRADQITVTAEAPASKAVVIDPSTTAVGIVAGFRDPAGKTFRLKTPAPGGNSRITVQVSPSGIALV